MKEYRLSTRKERIISICFTGAVLIGLGVLLYALRGSVALLIACGVGVLLVAALLIMYVVNVLKAVCVVDAANKTVEVRGVANFKVDVSNAVLLQTIAKRNGQTSIRVMVFTDEDMQVVATVPTMFTYRQGILADPVAKEMAAELGIAFQQNVPDWELDRKKYEEHMKEVAKQERREAKERRQKRMEMRIQKYKKGK